jgi:hypothetical protein
MNSIRWVYVAFLAFFVLASWGLRMFLSQRISDRVEDRENPERKR